MRFLNCAVSLWASVCICTQYPYLLQHGADPTKKNRDGNTPLDMVKEGDTDIQDLLRGDAALLDAAKKGCLARVQKLCSLENINCRDTQGRNSTPLHLAGNEKSFCFLLSCRFQHRNENTSLFQMVPPSRELRLYKSFEAVCEISSHPRGEARQGNPEGKNRGTC